MCRLEIEKESVNSVLFFFFFFFSSSALQHAWDQFSLSGKTCMCLYMSVCACSSVTLFSHLLQESSSLSLLCSVWMYRTAQHGIKAFFLTVLHSQSDMMANKRWYDCVSVSVLLSGLIIGFLAFCCGNRWWGWKWLVVMLSRCKPTFQLRMSG